MIVITGATGQLGRLVIQSLLNKLPASQIVAAVRNPARAADLAALGVQVRKADYTDPALLEAAFQGAEKVLLISSSEIGQRAAQHRNVIDAAKKAGVSLVAYTSILHADRSPLGLAAEHAATEAYLRESGLPHVLLRNGWYTENYLASVPPALQHGAFIGSAGLLAASTTITEDLLPKLRGGKQSSLGINRLFTLLTGIAVLGIALVSTVIAMVGFFAGIKRLGAADAATLSTLEPVVTFVLAAVFLDEPVTLLQTAGGAIVLGAVIALARGDTQDQAKGSTSSR